MLISIASNKYLFQLLGHLIVGLTALNDRDPALKPIIEQINNMIAGQKISSSAALMDLITRAQDIVKGYGVEGSDTASENPIENLPAIFFEIHNELENLSIKENLMNKSSLEKKIHSLRSKAYFLYRISK